ncbi:MAG: hypothetical protein ACI4QN_06980 [Candidatus Coproplasma sp.]
MISEGSAKKALKIKRVKPFEIHIFKEAEIAVFEIYEDIIRLDDSVNAYGITPLAYVMLDCGR